MPINNYPPARSDWQKNRIKAAEIKKYLNQGNSFIDATTITQNLENTRNPDRVMVEDILQKSLEIETLSPFETACLLNVQEPELWERMAETAGAVKRKVYDNRIVTFAPLYLGNKCVNDCAYCGFRRSNHTIQRKILNQEQIRREIEVLVGKIGHKRLILVYGEHPETDVDYIADSIKTIAQVKVKTRKGGTTGIRRCNINAAPMQAAELAKLHQAGIGTYQVFQETYHLPTYEKLHPPGTLKGDYLWRLYCMHRAFEAGIDDVGIGVLFGLYDWRFEVMCLLQHALELENKFGIGPHTVSFPRLEPAANTSFIDNTSHKINDENFKKLVTVIRLAIPYTGMILTARESATTRMEILPLGCTQTDASSNIGIGGYADLFEGQQAERQQFILGDTRSLDTVVRQIAEAGYITSFCTAGYRCGRTGSNIMGMLRSGREGRFCKLNAVITFREWLDDFATEETRKIGEKLIAQEIQEIQEKLPEFYNQFVKYYDDTNNGKRDLYF
ncbi:MAG: [FeFe] hydrogenase H-cluster radical SAM maturase HydG [Planctomycetes bacterium]|nr:[FeFe] hydrogenase H-cluster radical SAM maturase HydG [Planctomycetota bacterium]